MKKIGLLSLIVLFLLIVGLFSYKHLNPQVIRPDADYYSYSLNEMENLATAIVEVEYVKEKSSVVKLDKKDRFPLETKTFSEVSVEKVYKGNMNAGDTLSVVEYYAKWHDLYGSYVQMPNETYLPLSKGKKYLLFLYHGPTQPPDTYEIIGNHQGKFVIPPGKKGMDVAVKDMDIHNNNQEYVRLYNKVAVKYQFNN